MNRLLRPTAFCLTVLPLLLAWAIIAYVLLPGAPLFAKYAALLPLAYLLGSIPWGYFFLHWRRGLDIRDHGSGRTGMSNVLRTGGGRVAAVVLLLDLSKGVLVVLLSKEIIGTTGEVFSGLLALVGHNWPVFLNFRGGRGIATGLGGLSVMAPIPAAIAAAAFIPVTLISRYLSLGSITGVVTACLSLLALTLIGTYFSPYSWYAFIAPLCSPGPELSGCYSSAYSWYAFIGGGIILWQHRDNIQRLLRGTERRLGSPATLIQ